MKTFWKAAVTAATLAGASLFASGSAEAARWGVTVVPGGIGFSYGSGGYCDSFGCPTDFWDYEISYCPVFYRGHWYNGPVYYRRIGGTYYYWVRGGWHRDEWSGRR
ncbi:MAG: hypothetical protein JO348_01890, partial [Alphaproteobacteria bacterium]|nr:hypothetical protein [Alphaproteobacteria bacterium]